MLKNKDQALADVTDIFKFENWLRFYYIREDGDDLRIEIPENELKEIQERYTDKAGLAERLNNDVIDFEKSCNETCSFVLDTLDGIKYEPNVVPFIIDSKDFKLEIHLFNLWLDRHEEEFDQELMPFERWVELFEEWKATDEVQAYMDDILKKMKDASKKKSMTPKGFQGEETVH